MEDLKNQAGVLRLGFGCEFDISNRGWGFVELAAGLETSLLDQDRKTHQNLGSLCVQLYSLMIYCCENSPINSQKLSYRARSTPLTIFHTLASLTSSGHIRIELSVTRDHSPEIIGFRFVTFMEKRPGAMGLGSRTSTA